MKNQQVFKSFTALSFDGSVVTGEQQPHKGAGLARPRAEAGLPDVAHRDDFRMMLHERASTPYALSTRHRHWGINE